MPIPLQSNLDMNNLRDQVLWTLVNPGHLLDAPLLLRLEEMKLIADHLVACGLRFHPECRSLGGRPGAWRAACRGERRRADAG